MDSVQQLQQQIQQFQQNLNTITQMAGQLARSEQQNQSQLQQLSQSESRAVQQLQQIERMCNNVSQQVQQLGNVARQAITQASVQQGVGGQFYQGTIGQQYGQVQTGQQAGQFGQGQNFGPAYLGQDIHRQGQLTAPKPTYPAYNKNDQYGSHYQYVRGEYGGQYGTSPQYGSAQQQTFQYSPQFENPWYYGFTPQQQ
ncbi:MAG: hypothetical protein HPY70_02750 [Firmicutes bacterium]|nr:hypothetical protein [Bacillota bacterium]